MDRKKPVLQFIDVHCGYYHKPIIKGVSFSIYEGEFVGLIGANGTGKSTLLKAVSGLVEVTDGHILVQGEDNSRLRPKMRAQQIAVVPQSFDVDYNFTVYDMVMMGRNPYHNYRSRESEEDRRLVHEALEKTNTLKFQDRIFNTLSGGERQRVILARAIAQDTDIILLDEPTSALDMHHQIEVMELIGQLNEEGKTVLAVLHDLNMAARFCNRLVMLNEGHVIADGSPKDVMNQHNLRQIYAMKMLIRDNPIYEKPEVLAIRVLEEEKDRRPYRVHLICGADQSGALIEKLDAKGHEISGGVVEENSGDYAILKNVDATIVSQHPFSPVTIELQNRNLDLMRKADLVYICDIPFGEGNILNLYGLDALDVPIYYNENILRKDYTHGKLTEMLDQIRRKHGLIEVADDNDMMERIERDDILRR